MSDKAAGVFKRSFMGGFNKSDVLEYFDKLSFQHEQDKQELNAHIESLESENKKLNGEMQECASRLTDEQERASASISYANGLRAELSRQQFITEEKNNELQLQKSLCDQMQAKLAEYEEKTAQLEREKRETALKISVLSAGRESADAKAFELEKRAAEYKSDADHAGEELKALKGERERLIAAQEIAERRAEEYKGDAERIEREFEALKSERERLIAAREAAEKKAAGLEQSLGRAAARIDELTAALRQAELDRGEAERRYKEALSAARAAVEKLEPDEDVQPQTETALSDARERIDYVNNELSSFKDEIQELRRLTAESFNTAEKKLARLESTLASSSRSMESARGVAEGKASVPASGAAAKVRKLPESIRTVGGAAKGVYQVARQGQSSLFDSVLDSLERLVGKWSK